MKKMSCFFGGASKDAAVVAAAVDAAAVVAAAVDAAVCILQAVVSSLHYAILIATKHAHAPEAASDRTFSNSRASKSVDRRF